MVHILDLPVEVLQLISNYSVDITILRLVCKAFNGAFLDSFGREYLNTLQCFVLDPKRLMRLKCITSQAHLLRRVQRVCLTLDALEGKDYREFPVVGRQGNEGDDDFELWKDLRERARNTYRNRLPETIILELILADLRIARRPRLELDFRDYDPNDGYLRTSMTHRQVAIAFDHVLQSGCKISDLKVRHTRFMDPTRRRRRRGRWWCEQVLRAGESLEQLYVDLWGHNMETWTITELMQTASGLQGLYVKHKGVIGPVIDSPKFQLNLACSDALLRSECCPRLRTLDVRCVPFRPSVLLAALYSWRRSLRKLHFEYVYLTSPGQHWLEVLRLLHDSFEELTDLSLSELMEESRAFRFGKEPEIIVLQDGEESFDIALHLKGRQEIKQGLLLNVESGMPDTTWYGLAP